MQDHNWPLILGCSRQLLAAIQRSRHDADLDPTASESDRLYLSALRHEICGPADLASFWFTRDVRTDDCNVPDDQVDKLIWLCYQDRPWVRVAAMRLWRSYQDTLLPRIQAFVACPRFTDEELIEFERAIELLEEAIAVMMNRDLKNDSDSTSRKVGAGESIPIEYRTRYLTKDEAARLHAGHKVSNPTSYFKRLIEKGTIRTPMGSGQRWIFDLRDFPPESHEKLKPKTV